MLQVSNCYPWLGGRVRYSYMTISDCLDMLGLELRASWTQTRKANGYMVQSIVESTIKKSVEEWEVHDAEYEGLVHQPTMLI